MSLPEFISAVLFVYRIVSIPFCSGSGRSYVPDPLIREQPVSAHNGSFLQLIVFLQTQPLQPCYHQQQTPSQQTERTFYTSPNSFTFSYPPLFSSALRLPFHYILPSLQLSSLSPLVFQHHPFLSLPPSLVPSFPEPTFHVTSNSSFYQRTRRLHCFFS